MYAECLPENLSEATIHEVLKAVTPYSCLSKLVNKCNLYLKNMALKQRKYECINWKEKNSKWFIIIFRNNWISQWYACKHESNYWTF